MKQFTIQVDDETNQTRLDLYLQRNHLSELSRTHIQRLIKNGDILVNQKSVRPGTTTQQGDVIEIQIPDPVKLEVKPQKIPLDIIYEDSHLLVVNKAVGMVVHPAAGNFSNTLVNALLAHCNDLSGINGVLRPGIVHRLDKNTSGLLVVAKTDPAHQSLAKQLKDRTLSRQYLALVWGHLDEMSGKIEAPIGRSLTNRKKMAVVAGGREAITHWQVLKYYPSCCLLKVKLETGRTHQIRVHFKHHHHPLIGDPEYGGRQKWLGSLSPQHKPLGKQILTMIQRQALHASEIKFIHPSSKETMHFQAPLPDDINHVLEFLDRNKEIVIIPT